MNSKRSMRPRPAMIAIAAVLVLVTALPVFAQSTAGGRTRTRNYDVTVISNVPTAQVIVDGEASKAGVPVTVSLAAGVHNFEVRAEGFHPWTQSVDIRAAQTINASLQPIEHQLTVQSNVPARVLIDGQDSGGTTMRRSLRPGSYRITVQASGYIDFSTTVNLNRDQTVNAQLQPAFARARISVPQNQLDSTNPGALDMITVFVDGRPQVGNTFEVSPGRHTVRVRNGGMVSEIVQDFQPGRRYVIVPNFSATIQAE